MSIANTHQVTLLSAASATGALVNWVGGKATWTCTGTWGGATAQLQLSDDAGATWIDIDGASLTANGGWSNLDLPAYGVRVKITGGTGVSLNAKLARTS